MATSYRNFMEVPPNFGQHPTTLAFDPVSDVLWTGTTSGHVTAYYSPQAMRGVSFRVGGLGVHKIVAGENHVRAMSVSDSSIGTWAKGGMNKWSARHECVFSTFASSPASSDFVAAADALSELLLLNPVTGAVTRQAYCDTNALITHLEFSHSLILSGASDGALRSHDPRTGVVRGSGTESVVRAHSSGFLGLQASGNFVFTIGTSAGASRSLADPLVMVYDLRTMKSLSPIPFTNPAFINVVPNRPSSIAITSEDGFVSIVDVTNLNSSPEFTQLDVTAYVTSIAISPTGAYLASATSDGSIHLHTTIQDEDISQLPPLNGFEGQPLEFADTPAPLPEIEWTDSTPLNRIGLPHYETQFLSSWSPSFVSTPLYYPPPPKIPLQVANTIQKKHNITYAAVPKELKGRRNVAPAVRKRGGRFRSQNQANPETPIWDQSDDNVPKMYRHVEIEYSKFGVEDFDFGFYNDTEYSGLETHILHSYSNAVVQVMHYLTPIRELAKSHITTNCMEEHCLLCELGFVSRMLEDARGTNCQSSNFCKTLGVLARKSNWEVLIDYGLPKDVDHLHRIQQFLRFFVDNLAVEAKFRPHDPVIALDRGPFAPGEAPSPITQLLGMRGKNMFRCDHCGAQWERENVTRIVELDLKRLRMTEDPNFATAVRQGVLRQTLLTTSCPSCLRQSASVTNQRQITTKDLPPFLAVNAGTKKGEYDGFWLDTRQQTFLKPRIEIRGMRDGDDDPEVASYELTSIVVDVTEKDGHSHLVALIKIPDADPQESRWYLFNDFVVRNILETEALSLPGKWKLPAIFFLERTEPDPILDLSVLPKEISTSILHQDTSISLNRNLSLMKHETLGQDELPTPGTLVAIDAEFVSMQQEEIEYRSDGSHKVLRPARLSLARVSVLRGDGLRQGVPFIDDHIHTSEAIVDYLTEFSGIRYGDLDPAHSPHTLTPLKLVYKKLRLLVDRGCVFIGHGLSKDFRIINIYVPPDQVIDTVDLYFLRSRQRRLSLRFLAWFVLNENIQADTHDSIEDARSALNLYKAALEYEAQGIFDQKLEALYKEGRQYNFKPPPLPGASDAVSTKPPMIPAGGMFPLSFEHNATSNIVAPMDNKFPHIYPSSHSGSPNPVPFSSYQSLTGMTSFGLPHRETQTHKSPHSRSRKNHRH